MIAFHPGQAVIVKGNRHNVIERTTVKRVGKTRVTLADGSQYKLDGHQVGRGVMFWTYIRPAAVPAN